MAFGTLEESVNQSNKILLYEFTVGATTYRYTNAQADYVYLSNTYSSIPIDLGEVTSSSDINKQSVTIKMRSDQTLPQRAIWARSTSITEVTVMEMQLSDESINTVFIGKVLSYQFTEAEVKIPCESIYSSIQRLGIHRDYGPSCPHLLYEANTCRLSSSTYRVDDTIDAVNGSVITINSLGQPNDYFTGGYISFSVAGDVNNTLMIVDHTGLNITLEYVSAFVVSGLAVQLYPGCDRSAATCNSKFSNIANHGGFIYHPTLNPYIGAKIF